MRKILIGMLVLVFGIFVACESTDDGTSTTGTFVIQTFDAPFQGDVQHIYLNITEVSIHKAVPDSIEDTLDQWIVLSDVDTTIDFLELVNGQTAVLVQTELDTGHYSQLRLLLGEGSSIVVDSVAYDLRVPSGSESGVKLILGFTILPDELMEISLDFDAERSINKHPVQDRYSLRPTFRVFKSDLSGTLAGTVIDSTGTGIEDISVYAVSNGDTVATLSGKSGGYKFILLSGTYDISAQGYELSSDTSYTAAELSAGDKLKGYDFIMN